MGRSCSTHGEGEREGDTKFWSENLKERDHLEALDIDRSILLEWIIGKYGGKLWIRLIWLRI
jgi:hypothetical protein